MHMMTLVVAGIIILMMNTNMSTITTTIPVAADMSILMRNMNTIIIPPVIPRTVNVSNATLTQNTVMSAGKALPTAPAACRMTDLRNRYTS